MSLDQNKKFKRALQPGDIGVVSGSKKNQVVMEIIGEQGQVVGEYVDNGKDKKLPYQQLIERRSL